MHFFLKQLKATHGAAQGCNTLLKNPNGGDLVVWPVPPPTASVVDDDYIGSIYMSNDAQVRMLAPYNSKKLYFSKNGGST